MRTILLVAIAVVAVWAVLNRERIYVRDPVATVYSNDVRQTGVQVYLNASQDVLLEKDQGPGTASRILVQHWDMAAGTPASLTCLRWIACLTSEDHAPLLPIEWKGKGKYDQQVMMEGREVTFVDGSGATVRIVL